MTPENIQKLQHLFNKGTPLGMTPALLNVLNDERLVVSTEQDKRDAWGDFDDDDDDDDEKEEKDFSSVSLQSEGVLGFESGVPSGEMVASFYFLKMFQSLWADVRGRVTRGQSTELDREKIKILTRFLFSASMVGDEALTADFRKKFETWRTENSPVTLQNCDLLVRNKNDFLNGILLSDLENFVRDNAQRLLPFLDDVLLRNLSIYEDALDILPSPAFETNAAWLVEDLPLLDEQKRALALSFPLLLARDMGFPEIIETMEKAPGFQLDHFCSLLDQAFSLSEDTFISLFRQGKGAIATLGIGHSKATFRAMRNEPITQAFERHFLKKMLAFYDEKIDLMRTISSSMVAYVDTSDTEKSGFDFSHIGQDVHNLVAAAEGKGPRKILIAGKPGSGKTSLAEYILSKAKKPAVVCEDPDGDPIDEYSVNSVRAVLAALGTPIFLVDNVEMLGEMEAGRLAKKKIRHTEIWVAQDVAFFKDAINAFDMVVDIPAFPYEKRKKMAESLFDDPETRDKIAKVCATPGEIKKLYDWSQVTGQTTWPELASVANSILQAHIKSKSTGGNALPLQLHQPSENHHGFEGVVGCSDIVTQAKKIISGYHHADAFKALGAKPPKGVLLTGDPGMGKTHLVKAMAHEAGVPLLIATSAALARDPNLISAVFAEARRQAPCILFLDELDAIGARGKNNDGSPASPERQGILNRLLTEIDGFEGLNDVMVIGATHRSEVLDEALTRSGRLGWHISFQAPNLEARKEVWMYYAQDKPIESSMDWVRISRLSAGLSPADIHEAMDTASLNAAFAGDTVITQKHVADAIDHVVFGAQAERQMIEEEIYRTAVHEAGHAVVSWLMDKPLERATVRPMSHALGFVQHVIDESKIHNTKQDMEKDICILFAGGVAEQSLLNSRSEGASSDLRKIRAVIQSMVRAEGMGPRPEGLSNETSNETLREVEIFEQRFADEQYQKTQDLVSGHQHVIEALAKTLVQNREMDHEQLKDFFNLQKKLESGVVAKPSSPKK